MIKEINGKKYFYYNQNTTVEELCELEKIEDISNVEIIVDKKCIQTITAAGFFFKD